MARAKFIKKAQKDYPEHGIKKGDSYYYWKFRYGGKHFSKTPPRRSQLTQSGFFATLYDLEDGLSDRFAGLDSSDDIQSAVDSLKDEIQELLDETQGNLDNMPEQLQESSVNRERIDALEGWISDLDGIDTEIDEELSGEEKENRIQEIIDEITGTSANL